MAKGFKAGGGGGGDPLNFKVVGNPKPENPKENTIWVDTDEAIPEWMISADEPSGMRAENESVGSVVAMNDSSEAGLTALTLYGKTIQNGTPTPEAPVPLETPGADGNVAVTVCGKNLFALKDYKTTSDFITRETKNGVLKVVVVNEGGGLLTVIVSAFISASFVGTNNFPAGTYTYNGAARVVRSGISNNENTRVHLILADGTSTTIDHGTTKAIAQGFSVEKITFMSGTLDLRLNDTVTLLPILESGNSAIQTLTIQTPNGLPGIPVSSGGNYIDENGQMWICDEIDFARGNYVQRIGSTIYDGTSTWITHAASGGYLRFSNQKLASTIKKVADSNEIAKMLCSALRVRSANGTYMLSEGISLEANGQLAVYVAHYAGDLDAWKDYLTRNPMHVIYALAKPIETDLTVEQIAQYSALHTNYPNTTIYNDEGADMKVGYVSVPKEGFVWIKTGTSSQTEFNALKKNGIYIHPILAKQYIDGARVIKTAQIYQRGAWRDWFDGVIFRNGAKNDHITGGWDGYTSGTVLTVNKSNSPRTNNHIDLTGFKKLYVTFVTADRPTDSSGTPAGSYGIRVYLSTVSGATPVDIGAISAGTLSADISNIDEPVMIKCDAHTYNNGGSGTISEIWCE